MAIFNCPTPPPGGVWPYVVDINFGNRSTTAPSPAIPTATNRSDYAVNGGTQWIMWGGGPSAADGYAGNGFSPT